MFRAIKHLWSDLSASVNNLKRKLCSSIIATAASLACHLEDRYCRYVVTIALEWISKYALRAACCLNASGRFVESSPCGHRCCRWFFSRCCWRFFHVFAPETRGTVLEGWENNLFQRASPCSLYALFHHTTDRSRRYKPYRPIQRCERVARLRTLCLSWQSCDKRTALDWLQWLVALSAIYRKVKRSRGSLSRSLECLLDCCSLMLCSG